MICMALPLILYFLVLKVVGHSISDIRGYLLSAVKEKRETYMRHLPRLMRSNQHFSGSAVSSGFKILDAQNLTCLQTLPNELRTNSYSLKHRSFWSVWTQKQSKSRCILGAFIVSLKRKFRKGRSNCTFLLGRAKIALIFLRII